MDYEYDIGICCYCNGECNPHSQACGECSRNVTMFSIGMKPLPKYLESKFDDSKQSDENDVNSNIDE